MCSNSQLVRNLGLGLLEWQRWLGMMAHTWSPQCEDIPEHSKNFRLQVGRVLKRTRLAAPLKYMWRLMRPSCKVLVAQFWPAHQSPWTRVQARKTRIDLLLSSRQSPPPSTHRHLRLPQSSARFPSPHAHRCLAPSHSRAATPPALPHLALPGRRMQQAKP